MDYDGPRRVALVVNPQRVEAVELASRARLWWKARDFEVVEYGELEPPGQAELPEGGVRFAVSLGGDGTLLRTVQLVVDRTVPILGIHLGHLGYLTEVEPSAMERAFERLEEGRFEIEERVTLDVLIGRGGDVPANLDTASLDTASLDTASLDTASLDTASLDGRPSSPPAGLRRLRGLNEASIEKTMPGHTIRFSVEIAGRPFLTYAADGLLVATPTGSTAYNLSLRGPVLSPQLRALVVTPISPHMLFDRALVLAPDEPVRLQLLDDRPALLVVDGSHVVPLGPEDAVLLAISPVPAAIVRLSELRFHDVLRRKFNLTDR